MIEIHGQKMFRVALRNQSPSTLMFCSIHHRKVGLKVLAVSFWTDVNGVIQNLTLKGSRGDMGFLFFSKSIPNYFGGPCTFNFEVQVGALAEAFYYNLDDKLMRDQLWKAAQNKLLTDMEFIVKKKSFAAHKVVVSARSPVFAAMFNNDMLESKTNQVKIDDVDPLCFERFLEFIYTGKINGAADDENLMKVADKYQIDTLKNVCLYANQEITPEELTSLMISLQPDLLVQPTVVNR
jgi:speckle-type POZ protein